MAGGAITLAGCNGRRNGAPSMVNQTLPSQGNEKPRAADTVGKAGGAPLRIFSKVGRSGDPL